MMFKWAFVASLGCVWVMCQARTLNNEIAVRVKRANAGTCTKDEFLCNSGECISSEYVCNNFHNCKDGSDEKDCESWNCTFGRIKCDNGLICMRANGKCDGTDSCGDNMDEKGCGEHEWVQCLKGWKRCKTTNLCINEAMRCNGENNCWDNSDEEDCD